MKWGQAAAVRCTPSSLWPVLPNIFRKWWRLYFAKDQLNSYWIYEVIVSAKIPTKNYKDFQGRNLCNFWILEKRWPHKFTLNLTDLYHVLCVKRGKMANANFHLKIWHFISNLIWGSKISFKLGEFPKMIESRRALGGVWWP